MESDREESIETTLRIMAIIMRQKEKTIQVDFTPEFLEEIADEIKNLRGTAHRMASFVKDLDNWEDMTEQEIFLDFYTDVVNGE
jgi:hypothetical protein